MHGLECMYTEMSSNDRAGGGWRLADESDTFRGFEDASL